MGKLSTTSEFIRKAINVHGNTYIYNKINYKGSAVKVSIGCKLHGYYDQKPNHHLSGRGCPVCSNLLNTQKLSSNTADFVAKAKIVHGGKYDYSNMTYITSKKKVSILCKKCSKFFNQIPSLHLAGSGCPFCCATKTTTILNSFKSKSYQIHGNAYDYSKVDFKVVHDHVVIGCNTCKKEFSQQVYVHMQGHGCPNCSKSGFKPDSPAILYYLSIDNGRAYKIGITNNTVEERFTASDLSRIQVLSITKYSVGRDAYNYEQAILNRFKEYKYKGVPLLSSGNTELFTKDVLEQDFVRS